MQNDANQTILPSSSNPSKQEDIPYIDGRAKKGDILAAYKEVLKKYEEKAAKAKTKEVEIKKTKGKEIVEKASQYTVEKIIQDFSNLEGNIRRTLDDLSERLVTEAKKLEEVKQAIGIEKKNLEEIHDIKTAANTLAELIQTNETRKKEFEKGAKRQEEEFEREKYLKREQWKREQEDYNYKTAQERRKDKDTYETGKIALEKELQERMQNIARQEEDINDLRKKAENFDEELGAAVEKIKEETENRIKREEKNKADLLAEKVLREKELANLKIVSFSKRAEEQNAEIEILKTQLNIANKEAKDIAVKVIEGASGVKALQNVNKIAMEQARGMKREG